MRSLVVKLSSFAKLFYEHTSKDLTRRGYNNLFRRSSFHTGELKVPIDGVIIFLRGNNDGEIDRRRRRRGGRGGNDDRRAECGNQTPDVPKEPT